MSARSSMLMADFLGIPVSPSLIHEAEVEAEAIKRGCTVREIINPKTKPKPYDQEAAAQLRAEREERNRQNYLKRYPNRSKT